MANGIACKHCGWYETDHFMRERDEETPQIKKGYTQSLDQCGNFGYQPEDPELDKMLNRVKGSIIEQSGD